MDNSPMQILIRCTYKLPDCAEMRIDDVSYCLLTSSDSLLGSEVSQKNVGSLDEEGNSLVWLFYGRPREMLMFHLVVCDKADLKVIKEEDAEHRHQIKLPKLDIEEALSIHLNWENEFTTEIISIDDVMMSNEDLFEKLPTIPEEGILSSLSPRELDTPDSADMLREDNDMINSKEMTSTTAALGTSKKSPNLNPKLTTSSLDSICGSNSEIEDLLLVPKVQQSKQESSELNSSSSDNILNTNLTDKSPKIENEVFSANKTETIQESVIETDDSNLLTTKETIEPSSTSSQQSNPTDSKRLFRKFRNIFMFTRHQENHFKPLTREAIIQQSEMEKEILGKLVMTNEEDLEIIDHLVLQNEKSKTQPTNTDDGVDQNYDKDEPGAEIENLDEIPNKEEQGKSEFFSENYDNGKNEPDPINEIENEITKEDSNEILKACETETSIKTRSDKIEDKIDDMEISVETEYLSKSGSQGPLENNNVDEEISNMDPLLKTKNENEQKYDDDTSSLDRLNEAETLIGVKSEDDIEVTSKSEEVPDEHLLTEAYEIGDDEKVKLCLSNEPEISLEPQIDDKDILNKPEALTENKDEAHSEDGLKDREASTISKSDCSGISVEENNENKGDNQDTLDKDQTSLEAKTNDNEVSSIDSLIVGNNGGENENDSKCKEAKRLSNEGQISMEVTYENKDSNNNISNVDPSTTLNMKMASKHENENENRNKEEISSTNLSNEAQNLNEEEHKKTSTVYLSDEITKLDLKNEIEEQSPESSSIIEQSSCYNKSKSNNEINSVNEEPHQSVSSNKNSVEDCKENNKNMDIESIEKTEVHDDNLKASEDKFQNTSSLERVQTENIEDNYIHEGSQAKYETENHDKKTFDETKEATEMGLMKEEIWENMSERSECIENTNLDQPNNEHHIKVVGNMDENYTIMCDRNNDLAKVLQYENPEAKTSHFDQESIVQRDDESILSQNQTHHKSEAVTKQDNEQSSDPDNEISLRKSELSDFNSNTEELPCNEANQSVKILINNFELGLVERDPDNPVETTINKIDQEVFTPIKETITKYKNQTMQEEIKNNDKTQDASELISTNNTQIKSAIYNEPPSNNCQSTNDKNIDYRNDQNTNDDNNEIMSTLLQDKTHKYDDQFDQRDEFDKGNVTPLVNQKCLLDVASNESSYVTSLSKDSILTNASSDNIKPISTTIITDNQENLQFTNNDSSIKVHTDDISLSQLANKNDLIKTTADDCKNNVDVSAVIDKNKNCISNNDDKNKSNQSDPTSSVYPILTTYTAIPSNIYEDFNNQTHNKLFQQDNNCTSMVVNPMVYLFNELNNKHDHHYTITSYEDAENIYDSLELTKKLMHQNSSRSNNPYYNSSNRQQSFDASASSNRDSAIICDSEITDSQSGVGTIVADDSFDDFMLNHPMTNSQTVDSLFVSALSSNKPTISEEDEEDYYEDEGNVNDRVIHKRQTQRNMKINKPKRPTQTYSLNVPRMSGLKRSPALEGVCDLLKKTDDELESIQRKSTRTFNLVNDDDLYPDALTPSKADSDIRLDRRIYDIPYIDDDAFYSEEFCQYLSSYKSQPLCHTNVSLANCDECTLESESISLSTENIRLKKQRRKGDTLPESPSESELLKYQPKKRRFRRLCCGCFPCHGCHRK